MMKRSAFEGFASRAHRMLRCHSIEEQDSRHSPNNPGQKKVRSDLRRRKMLHNNGIDASLCASVVNLLVLIPARPTAPPCSHLDFKCNRCEIDNTASAATSHPLRDGCAELAVQLAVQLAV
jgi:hypothetical protein